MCGVRGKMAKEIATDASHTCDLVRRKRCIIHKYTLKYNNNLSIAMAMCWLMGWYIIHV